MKINAQYAKTAAKIGDKTFSKFFYCSEYLDAGRIYFYTKHATLVCSQKVKKKLFEQKGLA